MWFSKPCISRTPAGNFFAYVFYTSKGLSISVYFMEPYVCHIVFESSLSFSFCPIFIRAKLMITFLIKTYYVNLYKERWKYSLTLLQLIYIWVAGKILSRSRNWWPKEIDAVTFFVTEWKIDSFASRVNAETFMSLLNRSICIFHFIMLEYDIDKLFMA